MIQNCLLRLLSYEFIFLKNQMHCLASFWMRSLTYLGARDCLGNRSSSDLSEKPDPPPCFPILDSSSESPSGDIVCEMVVIGAGFS